MRKLLLLITVILLSGCAHTARIYNLGTGQILKASFVNTGSGHGTITAISPDGRELSGEYTTISGKEVVSSFGSASVTSQLNYSWATAQGFSFTQPGQQYGSATLVGGSLVIEIVYVVDPWTSHGHGIGRDNKGGQYKIMF